MTKTLIVGYGNTLRGDDGVGVRVAERIAAEHPEIDCLIAHQLFPEMSDRIAYYESVVFIDAAVDIGDLVVSEITPQETNNSWNSHCCSPQSLISAASGLFSSAPSRCFVIEIPAYEFDYGDHFSSVTAQMADKGVEVVNNILQHLTTASLQAL